MGICKEHARTNCPPCETEAKAELAAILGQYRRLEAELAARTKELQAAYAEDMRVGDALDEVAPGWEGEYPDAIRKLGMELDERARKNAVFTTQVSQLGLAYCCRQHQPKGRREAVSESRKRKS